MNILIILGHPNKNSFNHAIANACISAIEANGHEALFHDLYAENFEPVLRPNRIDPMVEAHIVDLRSSDAIIFIHPNWWGQAPAIVKGWLDKVLQPGVAYTFVDDEHGNHRPAGLLTEKVALVFNTSNAPCAGDDGLLETTWKEKVFRICGIDRVSCKNFGGVGNSDNAERNGWLSEVKLSVSKHFPKG